MNPIKHSNFVEKSNLLVLADDSNELQIWSNIRHCEKPVIHVITLPNEKNDRISVICSNPTQNVIVVGTDWGNVIVLHLDTLKPDSDDS